jgi:DNA-binding SARP family transcriptional activator
MTRLVLAAGRLLRGLLALAALLALIVGVPWLLATLTGWPLPDHMPGLGELGAALTSPLDDQKILNLLALVAWALWLLFVRDVLVEVILTAGESIAARRGRPRPSRRRPVGPVRLVAAVLVGAIAGAILLDTLRGALNPNPNRAAAANAAAHTAAVAVTPAQPGPAQAAISSRPRSALTPADLPGAITTVAARFGHSADPDVPSWARNAPGGIHHVVTGDNLWDIARDKLGDPFRWREIYVLSRGKPQANGYALRDPDEIHIGWVLAMPARNPAPPATGTGHGDPGPATPAPTAPPATATPATPTPSAPSSTAPASPPPASPPAASSIPAGPVPAAPSPTVSAVSEATASQATPTPTAQAPDQGDQGHGVTLPSRGWVSLGLAATIAAVAALLRLQRRRRARLAFPIPLRTGPAPAPVPDSLRPADAAGSRVLATRHRGPLPDLLPETPRVPAPIGVDEHGSEISLFEVPGPALALDGDGAPAATRAIVAAVLATGVSDHAPARPMLVTAADTLARLLPDGVAAQGLDPRHETFDGERLIVVADTAAAVTHLESEMIHRRRLLDSMGVDSADQLNARQDHAEHLPPYVLLVAADPRYTARIGAVAAHRHTLHLHPVILGTPEGPEVAHLHVAAGGTFTTAPSEDAPADWPLLRDGRLAVLAARDLADVLGMLAAVAPRPETGDEPADLQPVPDAQPRGVDLSEIPAPATDAPTPVPVRLGVLGPPTLATADAPIATGVRRGSLAVLAVLAAHPKGRTFEELAADLHPDADPETGVNRVRTDLNAIRSLLREATGIEGRGKFVVHDGVSGRYRIDPDLIEVDLWRMLSAIDRANKTGDDETLCLAALREAVACYGGDFAEGQDRAWILDYATTYRHQLLGAYARIAEILEADQPDQAIAALEAAIERDPVNEELYQRLMRIHGRLGRPDAVRRTLRLLENRLAELGEAEPCEATRRVAARQLKPSPTGHG